MKKSTETSDAVVNLIDEARQRSERKLQSEIRDVIYAELCRLKDDEIDDVVVSILEARGIDPDRYLQYVKDDDEPIAVFKQRKPFGLDKLDNCYQDACSAAGGEWSDTATVRGCKAPKNATTAEKAATFLAFHINSQECLWRTAGSAIGAIIGALF